MQAMHVDGSTLHLRLGINIPAIQNTFTILAGWVLGDPPILPSHPPSTHFDWLYSNAYVPCVSQQNTGGKYSHSDIPKRQKLSVSQGLDKIDPFMSLVGGFKDDFYFPFHIWDVIPPIDFHSIIFQRGRAQPPTRSGFNC